MRNIIRVGETRGSVVFLHALLVKGILASAIVVQLPSF